MRQDVFTSRMVAARHRPAAWLLACLVPVSIGCQLANPQAPGGLPPGMNQQGMNASYKPPQDNPSAPTIATAPTTTEGKAAEASAVTPASPSATARIRGQSPNPWSDGTAGSSDSYRTPMSATNTTAPVANRYNQTYGSPNSLPAIPSGDATSGQFTTAPLATSPLATSPLATSPPAIGQPVQYGVPSAQTAPPTGSLPPPMNTGPQPPAYGYGSPGTYQAPGGLPPGVGMAPNEYGSAIVPGATQFPSTMESAVAPGVFPEYDQSGLNVPDITAPGGGAYQPRQRIAPIDVFVQEARTGRIILGGSVNSDLGVAGQVIIDERNFDIRRFPRSWDQLWSGRAFRGGGQNFRAELMPGSLVQRYSVNWTERNLFGYLPYSLSVGGFLFTRQYRDWTEQRLGGRFALGYEVTKDLAISGEMRLEDVNISSPRVSGVNELDSALGSNDLYTARFRIAHDTRDSPFMSTEGALLEVIFDQVFGEYDYSRANLNYSRYFLVRERADGGGRHTIASTWRFGVTGSQTPIFENYFAGGYSTLRGWRFRGASPVVNDVQVGGELLFLGSLEYLFPLTADEMLRGVAFVDYGTVEQDLTIQSENFRVAPGLGLRVSVPALGPAPLAFDFAAPINKADGDTTQVFSFYMGFTR
jgi:outer membrane protein insertion porin family